MPKMIVLTLAISLMVQACSLNSNMPHRLILNDGSVNVNCSVNKIKIKHYSAGETEKLNLPSDKSTFVYGRLQLTNISDAKLKYNLNDYKLIIGSKTSTKLAIDSVAHYIITDKILEPKQSVCNKIYWIFDGIVDQAEITKSKLIKIQK